MTKSTVKVPVKFSCKRCGSALQMPDVRTAQTVINCPSCDAPVGTWGNIEKEMKRQLVAETDKAMKKMLRDTFKDSKYIKFK